MKRLSIFIFMLSILSVVTFNTVKAKDLENTLYLDLKDGRVTIEMYPESAPNHVARIKELVKEGFYDGLKFHRVLDGFMAQTGDPVGNGTGGSGKNLKAEFNDRMHVRGTLSMARSANPDSADSQFFIMFDNSPHLDGQYTVWGQVIDGIDHVMEIKRGSQYNNGSVDNPDTIIKMQTAEDAAKAEKKEEKAS